MLGGGHGRLGGSRVDDDDLGVVRVATDPLPHDRVGDAQVGADEDDDVGLLEVGVGVRRRVEAEGLFVGNDRGGHALAGVAVAVHHPHAELCQRSKQRHLLGRYLPGRQEGHRFRAVPVDDGAESLDERGRRRLPANRSQPAAGVAPQRGDSSIGSSEGGERLPSLGAGHAVVDRIVGGWAEVHGRAVAQVHVERAPGRAEAAHHRRRGIGLEARRHLPKPEPTGLTDQLPCESTVAPRTEPHLGGLAVVKKIDRSASSPPTVAASTAVARTTLSGFDRPAAVIDATAARGMSKPPAMPSP